MTYEEANERLSYAGTNTKILGWMIGEGSGDDYAIYRYDVNQDTRQKITSIPKTINGVQIDLDVVVFIAIIAAEFYRKGIWEGEHKLQDKLKILLGI